MHDILEFDRGARSRELTSGVLCGLMVLVFYCGFTLVSRPGLTWSLGPFDLTAVRLGASGALLLPVVLYYRLQHLRLTDAVGLALLGGLGFIPLCYVGLGLAPAAHGGVLLHGCLPLFILILMRLSGAEARSRLDSLGLGLIAAGVLMMIMDTLLATSPLQLLGDAYLLTASLSWASYGVLAARLRVSPLHATTLVSCISLCLFLAIPGLTTIVAIPLLGEEQSLLSIAGVAATTVGMLFGMSALRSGERPSLIFWQAFLRRRREQYELLGQSDRTLRDLGLSRTDALRGTRHPWWDDGTEKPGHF